jgi:hypothetical protein
MEICCGILHVLCAVLPALGVVAYFFRRRLRKVFNCCDHPKPEQEPKRQVTTFRIRIQHFSSVRVRSLSGPGFRELKRCRSLGDYRSWFASTERFYNIPNDVAMHSIRISKEDPDPGEINQGRHAWTRNILTNFKIFLQ